MTLAWASVLSLGLLLLGLHETHQAHDFAENRDVHHLRRQALLNCGALRPRMPRVL
jgi:hypothetical protein